MFSVGNGLDGQLSTLETRNIFHYLARTCYIMLHGFCKKKKKSFMVKPLNEGEIPIHSPRSTFKNSSNMNVVLNYLEHIKDLTVSSKRQRNIL